ncbi:F-box-like domain superfamily [Arabidopsis suecica]|uniref:F-box-like domain superfamily n=1 Tax=Arabidopsis suecica TaxID=45249 RepID=A0A8T2FYU3_ARASU|nr:F-box-like domain superfamily [Arabidopsis suecica]
METPNDLVKEEKRQGASENQDWSKLCPDLLRPILESLSSIDFHRAKTVCSDWYSVWKTCKGYDSKWNQNSGSIFDMAYKNSKLYLYTLDHHIKIYDFSGDSPKEEGLTNPYSNHPFRFDEKPQEYIWKRKIVIAESGEMMNEMLIFGHGVTMRAQVHDVGDGIKRDSICFVDDDLWPDVDRPSNCGIFDLATSRITWPKRYGVYIDQKQWFLPGFA